MADPVNTDAPPAKDVPAGTTVLATDGVDRTNLRQGALGWAVLLFGAGFIVGRVTAKR